MKQKVFGIGLHRTGTTSLRRAMPMLGYATVPPWRWTGRYPHTLTDSGMLRDAFYLAARYDACIHQPFMTSYRELYEAYPQARFILTERDEGKWVKSLLRFFNKANWPEFRYVYGTDAHPEAEGHLRQVFRRHNREAREFFADKPGSLLVIDIDKGQGWKELCDFLQEPVPAAAFPHSNTGGSLYAHFVMTAIPFIATLREAVDGSREQAEPSSAMSRGFISVTTSGNPFSNTLR